MGELLQETADITAYLELSKEVDFDHLHIKIKAEELFKNAMSDIEKARIAFEFVRDEIAHSWDIQSERVTCNASEALATGEGICYAKSHLLAALLRHEGIPTGFCYQRLVLFEDPKDGHCIHALNAVYIEELDKWIRLDARGNKSEINATFSLYKEQLAFVIDEELGEYDDPIIYARPNEKTLNALRASKNAITMYKHHLPQTM